MSKRRRWLRKMIAQGAADQPLFYFKNPDVSLRRRRIAVLLCSNDQLVYDTEKG